MIRRYNCKLPASLFGLLLCCLSVMPLRADTITITGLITQSVQDGTGPAVNNPDLNGVIDGDTYTVEFSFLGSISSPGTHNLTDVIFSFSTASTGLTENQFNVATMTVTQNGSIDLISVLGCLQTGSGCNQGNELSLNFMIPSADLNAGNVPAMQIAGLLPLDLLEDDGATEIQGSVSSYSYTPPSNPVPEPLGIESLAFGTLALALGKIRRWTK